MNPHFKPGNEVKMCDGSKAKILGHIATGGQGEVYKVSYSSKSDKTEYCALKWYYNTDNQSKRHKECLEDLIKFGRDNNYWFKDAFTWPRLLTQENAKGEYGFLMDLIPDDMVSMTDVLNGKCHFESAQAELNACMNIADNVGLFHQKYKKSFKDLNDGNIFLDLNSGRVMICDCDNVANDDNSLIIGKIGYMAPEICTGAKGCSKKTDLHSLAVILYSLLMHDRPFEGRSTYGIMDSEREIEVYGKNPIFVFDPKNASNRPMDSGIIERWENQIDQTVKDNFITTFTEGLRDSSKRISCSDWTSAFKWWIKSIEKGSPFASLPQIISQPKKIQLILFIIDSSNSMNGQKMEEVNRALKKTVPDLIKYESDGDVIFLADYLQFSSECNWYNPVPVPLMDFKFDTLMTTGSATQFKKACMELDNKLNYGNFIDQNKRYKRPIIMLLSDGAAINYEDHLRELKNNRIFSDSIRISIGIDDDKSKSDLTLLQEFANNKDYVIKTDKIKGRLAELIHTMTIQVSRASISGKRDDQIVEILKKFKGRSP